MGLFLLVLLVAWFIVYRTGADATSIARSGLAWCADRLGGVADRLASRSPLLAGLLGKGARAVAAKLRPRHTPMQPRTSDGQALLNAAGGLTAVGVVLVLVWVRLVAVDAVSATRGAYERYYVPGEPRWRHVMFGWSRWPREGEPRSPVRATATRTDREPPPALPAASSGQAEIESSTIVVNWRTP